MFLQLIQISIWIATEYPKRMVLQKSNTTCIYLYGDVKTLQGGQMPTCLLAEPTIFKLKKESWACAFEEFVARKHN